MAEELDTTQKPKAELIKRPLNEYESSEGGTHGGVKHAPTSNRKKLVVKKKTPAPASPAGGPAKKPPKVVARGSAGGEAVPDASKQASAQEAPPASPVIAPKPSGETTAPGSASPGNASKEIKPTDQARPPFPRNVVSSFPVTQRPAAAAGRVGGKFVGPRPPREDGQNRSGQAPFRPRPPAGVTSRAPGKFVGPRTAEGGQHSNRPGAPRPGGGRPGQRPRGPVRPGLPPGGTPRPGGFGAPRPGMGRLGPPRVGTRPGISPQTPPAIENKGPVKKSFKSKKPVYTRREK
ncbi:MAG: translation initiation factor IF-2, partial [Treponema sp.]|nr:translation initiation factor IF-2 [Treponema sp.]